MTRERWEQIKIIMENTEDFGFYVEDVCREIEESLIIDEENK